MSTTNYKSDHLHEVTPSASSCYPTANSKSKANGRIQPTAVSRSTMGGMVSALTAVLCGSAKQSDTDEPCNGGLLPPKVNGISTYRQITGTKANDTHLQPPTVPPRHVSRHSSTCYTSEDSDSEYCDASEPLTSPDQSSPRFNKYSDLPYIDEDSDKSQRSVSEQDLILEVSRVKDGMVLPDEEEELLAISETEYSADEEQVEEDVIESEDEMERVDSSQSEGEDLQDEHICDSDCDHSDEEVEDESEAASEDEEHECTSDCEHSEVEHSHHSESEYESEVDSNSEHCLLDSDEEVIEISENEASSDEEQLTDNDDEFVVCECDSNCPSDCEGNHHECSSECGCDQLDSENECQSEPDDNPEDLGHDTNTQIPQLSAIPATEIRVNPQKQSTQHSSLTTTGVLLEISSQQKSVLKPIERNNNRLQRNQSQRLYYRSNTTDMMGELKSAIDARVRRSASCRETSTDYRKKYAHLTINNHDIPEHSSKLDSKEREERRKQRRTRLRTLELKREQCLDELRDGTEENIADRLYRNTNDIHVETK